MIPNARRLSEEQALNKLAQLCSASEHCQSEMAGKCAKWGLDSDASRRVVAHLVKEGFVDDSRFAPLFVRDKARFAGWGPVKVRMQLNAKGVDADVVEQAIEAFPSDEWHAILVKALAAKLRTAPAPPGSDDGDALSYGSKLYASLVRFALQRGFEYDEVRKAISELG
ncbi:MAG: regulatory protein RecX [Marinilabiliaceae bacterium]